MHKGLLLRFKLWPSQEVLDDAFAVSVEQLRSALRERQLLPPSELSLVGCGDITSGALLAIDFGTCSTAVALAVPKIHEILVLLGSSGAAAAVYQLLKAWIDARNGRKIRLRLTDFEVETTQMSEERFICLAGALHDLSEQWKSEEEERRLAHESQLRQEILSQGVVPLCPKRL
jgi:hypothetical protein